MNYSTCTHCLKLFMPTPGSYGKFCSLSCSNRYRAIKQREQKEQTYYKSPNYCNCCDAVILFNKRKNKYCSASCSAKITNKVHRKRGPTAKEKLKFSSVKFIFCEKTQQWYCNKDQNGNIRRCSPYIKSEKEKYYSAARFAFNVYHYPGEFDLSLIEQNGWYSCPGQKRKTSVKNINGVSRDHIVSVSYGFKNNIDPGIIAHPANCRIILHSENKKKSLKCGLTVEELLLKIELWNKKYTERCIGLEPMTSNLEG